MYCYVSVYLYIKSNRECRYVFLYGKYIIYECFNDESFFEINNVKCFVNSCIEINVLMYVR